MSQNGAIINMRNVSKDFQTKVRKGLFRSEKTKVKALDNVSLTINEGEIFSLLGPNGAGKTTAIKILTTLLLPTSGTVSVDGLDIEKDSVKIRSRINAMFTADRSIYWKISGRQNLEYFGTLYYQSQTDIEERIEKVTKLLKLGDFLDRPVETYSSGQKYKVAFAKAIINDPKIIFLDEPTMTLDPRSAREMRDYIRHVNEEGMVIVLTTHNMSEAEQLSDRIAIIDMGKIIALDSPEALCSDLRSRRQLSIVLTTDKEPKIASIKGISSVSEVTCVIIENGYRTNVLVADEDAFHHVVEILSRDRLKIKDMRIETPTIEDVFLEKTGRLLSEDTTKR